MSARVTPESDTNGSAAPLHDTSRAEYVYQALRDAIQQGRFIQGARVREDEIARWLKVSRTPVREALHRLHSRGLLELAPGRGLVVVALSRQQIVELYAMRELLEGGAARMAAQHASPSEINAMKHLLAESEASGDDVGKQATINRHLHRTIYEAAHNRYLMNALHELTDALALLQSTTFSAAGRSMSALAEHRLLLRAIEEQAPDRAEEAARQHIRAACQVRLRMLFSA